MTQLGGTITHPVCRHLVRKRWLEGENEAVFLPDTAGRDDGVDGLRMRPITNRSATA